MERLRVCYLVGTVVLEETFTAPQLVVTAPLFGLCVIKRLDESGRLLSTDSFSNTAWSRWLPKEIN